MNAIQNRWTKVGWRIAWLVSAVLGLVAIATDAAELTAQPLAPRSAPRGATMFAMLPPSETGVVTENRYADPRIWGERYNEFPVGAIGTGVAIGDYDGDGRPDIFVVSKTESCRLFRNLGNWKFEDVTDRAGVGDKGAAAMEWKQGAAFVDVNNDGQLDLYVCRLKAPNLLYLNQGDGTFKEDAAARGLAVNDASGMAAFCDYDRDGWLDVFVQTNTLDVGAGPRGRRDFLFHNNRDGAFTDVTVRAGIRGEARGHSATWWDYDGDGWPDLYVANDFSEPDVLYHNNRDGTFTDEIDAVVPLMPHHAMGADLGDLNNDGLIDLFVAEMARSTHEKEQRTIAETRARTQVPLATSDSAPQAMRNVLYLNTGTGRMLEAAQLAGLAATDWTWSVRAEDLDNDGRVDLHFTNGMTREYDNVDLRARTMAVESSAERVRIMRTSPVAADTHFAFRNRGDLEFEDVSATWGLNQKGVSFGAAFGDLDGDGDLDAVVANYQAGVTLLRNDSDTGHRLVVELRGTASNRFGIGATVRIETASGVQVRQLVLARGYLSTSEPIVHFGLGDETLIKQLSVSWPSGRVQTFAEVAVDRRLIITEPATSGATDVEVVKGKVVAPQFSEVGPTANFALAGRETMPAPPDSLPALPVSSGVVVAGDFDRDGRLDFFVGGRAVPGENPASASSALLVNRGGKFEDVTDAFAPGLRMIGQVTFALWTDVDADGWLDLLVAVEWGGVRYWHNQGGRGFEDRSISAGFAAAGTGWWNSLAAADFNGDGRLDYVAGNLGLNTKYRADPAHPAVLFSGDFAGDGDSQIVEGYYEGDRLYPWATRSQLGAMIPAVLKKFPRNDAYARATLEEILGAEKLAAADRLTATELRSGIFLSQPDGTFRFEPLPRIAQIAPLQGIVAGDFDGDGFADIYAVQISSASVEASARFTGGLSQLLRGDGRGHFVPVPPNESGLVVPGAVKALSVADYDGDGWPDFLISRDRATTLLFRNAGVAGRHSLPLRLRGLGGNPHAVGAGVTVVLDDGTSQTSEVQAGVGYGSQSTGTLFFGYPDNNPPRLVRVRWPNGKVTEENATPGAMVLSQPEG